MQGLRAQIKQRQCMKGRAFYATVEIHNRLLDPQANKRLFTLGSGHYLWGGGGGKRAVLFQK